MHYYQFNIGDYASHTRHLTIIEDLAYRRLLDAYYLQERPLSSGISSVARQINMRDYETEIKAVLEEFWVLTDDGWINRRADQEIAKYQEFIEAGKRGAAKRWEKGGDKGGFSGANGEGNSPPNATPMVNNKHTHKTITIDTWCHLLKPDDIEEKVWTDYLELRKAKNSPFTLTALEGIREEAAKAKLSINQALKICCFRGWQGFRADWVKEEDRKEVQVYKPGFFMGRKLAGYDNG